MTDTLLSQWAEFRANHTTGIDPEIHGHKWRVTVMLRCKGFFNGIALQDLLDDLCRKLDGKYINEFDGCDCGTAEALGRWFINELGFGDNPMVALHSVEIRRDEINQVVTVFA